MKQYDTCKKALSKGPSSGQGQPRKTIKPILILVKLPLPPLHSPAQKLFNDSSLPEKPSTDIQDLPYSLKVRILTLFPTILQTSTSQTTVRNQVSYLLWTNTPSAVKRATTALPNENLILKCKAEIQYKKSFDLKNFLPNHKMIFCRHE